MRLDLGTNDERSPDATPQVENTYPSCSSGRYYGTTWNCTKGNRKVSDGVGLDRGKGAGVKLPIIQPVKIPSDLGFISHSISFVTLSNP